MTYANSYVQCSLSPPKSLTHWCIYPKWLKADFRHISRSGGFVTLVDHLSSLGSGVGFTVGAGSGVGIVSNEG